MFYSDPCSNVLQWARHAERCTPKGCKLVHFSVSFGTDGGCETASRYSVLAKRPVGKTAAENVGAAGVADADKSPRKGTANSAARRRRRRAEARAAGDAEKATLPARPPVQGSGTAANAERELSVDAAKEAPPPPSVRPTPAAEQAAELPPTTLAASTPGPTTDETETAQYAATAAVHATHRSTTHRHEPPLPLSCTKRQKTYVEAAATPAAPPITAPSFPVNAPINTPLHTPNGTKGYYAGGQSLSTSPGGSQSVAVYMERGGELGAERMDLNHLLTNSTN